MKIAIVGSGVSGLVCAWILNRKHDVVVFEKEGRIGGHVHTHSVADRDETHRIDSGFIVFNELNYPLLCRLFSRLGVATKATDMSFGVRVENQDLEYSARSVDALFAQRRNLWRPRFWGMIRGLQRFYREAPAALLTEDAALTLGEFLDRGKYPVGFVDDHILPMAAALWSASRETVRDFPLRSIVEFFANHRMLQIRNRPQWRVVEGGSSTYLKPLTEEFRHNIRTNCAVERVTRGEDGVSVVTQGGAREDFDAIVFASHADQALKLLGDPTAKETEVLSALRFQKNDAVLHCDTSVMPKRKKAWAAWNYHVDSVNEASASVTYDMSILQGIKSSHEYLVTLNRNASIASEKTLARMNYEHPLFDHASCAAKTRFDEISGLGRTHYCGAYWGHGFHEDGVRSAVRVASAFGMSLDS